MTKKYKKIKEIGKGGMSTVYLAKDISTNQLVALKVLKESILSDKDYIKRFFREARITSQLDHPNIIKVFESNFDEGIFYIVMEYIKGGDFRELFNSKISSPKSKWGWYKKIQILSKVLNALDYAHQKGIVHRDIKPSNILLTGEMDPKLSDFGIATALWGQESRYTRTDEIVGTMDYIAPEQKESSKRVDLRADIYSIGIIMYQAITGRKPQGAFPDPIDLCPSIPKRLNSIVLKCLQPLPTDRYKNALNLYNEIQEALKERKNTIKEGTSSVEPIYELNQYQKSNSMHEDNTKISKISNEGFLLLIEKLKTGSLAEKLEYKTKLINMVNSSHQDILIELLKKNEAEGFLRESVIQALGKIRSKNACSLLFELLTDPYYNKMAADAIGDIGCKSPEIEEKLFNLLLNYNEKSYIALIPLGKINSTNSIDLIAQYLKDTHTWIRELALEALSMITDERVIAHIENTANNDINANIRAKAKKILWRLMQ